MIIFSFYIIIALLSLSVQAVLFKGIKPDIVLILVFFYSLRYGRMKGLAYGAVAGLLVDFSSGFILGPNMMSKIFIGYLIPSIRQKMFQWNIIINTLIIIVFCVVDMLLVYICLETFADISFGNREIETLIIPVIYTTGISILVYPFLKPEKEGDLFLEARRGI